LDVVSQRAVIFGNRLRIGREGWMDCDESIYPPADMSAASRFDSLFCIFLFLFLVLVLVQLVWSFWIGLEKGSLFVLCCVVR
jgi:hypothetical protein